MRFPERSLEITGLEIEMALQVLSGQAREEYFLRLFRQGAIPDFFRAPATIALQGAGTACTLEVACDHLCFGTDDDFVYGQVNIITAQKMADICGAMLPTSKLVDEIWKQASVKLPPRPWGPPYDASMYSSARMTAQSRKLEQQRRAAGGPLGDLTSGNFKDYILVQGLLTRPDRTCIYGWHQMNGIPIQGAQLDAHERTYVDYSQAPRFVDLQVTLEGERIEVAALLADPVRCHLVSTAGSSTVARLPES